jgi:hypothetical protein
VDRITRSKLKTDRFAVEVEHSVEYVSEHKKQVAQYGALALWRLSSSAGSGITATASIPPARKSWPKPWTLFRRR